VIRSTATIDLTPTQRALVQDLIEQNLPNTVLANISFDVKNPEPEDE